MKPIFFVFSILLSTLSIADTLVIEDFSGVFPSEPDLTPKGIDMVLTIKRKGRINFVRSKQGEEVWNLDSTIDDVKVIEDIFIIPFLTGDSGRKYKLVLSGWKSSAGVTLYGNVFIYIDGDQKTGLPVTFYKENTVNK